MADSSEFLAILVILYLAECVHRAGPQDLVLDRRTWSGYRIKRAVSFPNRTRCGWVMLNPLRPDGPVFFLRKTPARSASPVVGDTCRELLATGRFDVDAAREACTGLRRQTRGIRAAVAALHFVCFGLFPVLLFFLGLRVVLLFVGVAGLLVSICCAVLYQQKTPVLNPHTSKLDLYGNIVRLGLYPIGALRAMDLLSRNFLSAFDPIAVATALCAKEEAARIVAGELAILRYSTRSPATDTACSEVAAKYRTVRIQQLEAFSAIHDLPVQPLMAPPAPQHAACRTYCPVCRAQYVLPEGRCGDCPEVLLQPIRTWQEGAEVSA